MFISCFRIFTYILSTFLVHEGCDRIWGSVILYFINLSIYGVNTGALLALGKQWMFGIVTFVSLWLIALPTIYFYAVKQNGGIEVLWACLNPPYIVLNAVLCTIIFSSDWNKHGGVESCLQLQEDGKYGSMDMG